MTKVSLDTSIKVDLCSDQKVLMGAGRARKERSVNDYLLGEMVRIRIDESQAEASRARGARGSRGRRHYLGILSGLGARRAEGGSFSRGMVEEGCCA